ncbi:MAG: hypothetical protein HY652_11265 [Acidobacteria bacterium]|nr:hypothetical protein [Acidobacteriota bacterium]
MGSKLLTATILIFSLVQALPAYAAGKSTRGRFGDDLRGEDSAIRSAAQRALGRRQGAVVVIEVDTGRIRSIVNQRMAVSAASIPCSTIKLYVTMAALQERAITGQDVISLTRSRGFDQMNLVDALAYSNNEFFERIGQQVGYPRMYDYFFKFGLGKKSGVNFFRESAGSLTQSPASDRVYSWGTGVKITALQLAQFVSALGNGGKIYKPQYLRTRKQREAFQPVLLQDLCFRDISQPVLEGMMAAVNDGTGKAACLPDVEQIYGKTGTCRRTGLFASFNEKEPRLAVVVILKRGNGPQAAAVTHRIYREILAPPLAEAAGQ